MTGRIAGFVTRADAGLRGPESVSHKFTPERGGVAVHYGGPAVSAANPGSDHSKCIQTWKFWQDYHMDHHGWVDIAYTGGFCNHGFAFAGRGVGARTAANGTNGANQNFYAVVWIGGQGQAPTSEALDAADWWMSSLRSHGAGDSVRPHQSFKPTSCPGAELVRYAKSRDRQAISSSPVPSPSPKPTPDLPDCRSLQKALHVDVDNLWGPITDKHLDALRISSGYHGGTHPFGVHFTQMVVGARQDGIWGPLSIRAHRATTSLVQQAFGRMGFDPQGYDGRWGPKTERAYREAREATHI